MGVWVLCEGEYNMEVGRRSMHVSACAVCQDSGCPARDLRTTVTYPLPPACLPAHACMFSPCPYIDPNRQ